MKEALNKGYLGEKLTVPKTLKMTDAMDEGILIASESDGKDPNEWIREVIAEALIAADYKYERSRRARMHRSLRWESLDAHEKSPVGATTEPSCK